MTSTRSQSNQQINSVIVAEDAFDPFFVYYKLCTLKNAIRQRAAGAATPIINKTTFSEIVIEMPSLHEQRRIASILSAYDDLIEVNRRRVAILEEMARRLFEEWFVHFRFPGHEDVNLQETSEGRMPEGWQRLSLPEIATTGFGFPFKSNRFNTEKCGSPVIRIRNVLDGTTDTYSEETFDDRYVVNDEDLLIGMDGIFHTRIWSGGVAALNQRVARLRPKHNRSPYWLYLSVLPKIKRLEATITGTTVAHLGARDLNNMSLLIPPRDVQERTDRLLEPLGSQIVLLRHQSSQLAAARDLLLPRLISGELAIADASAPEHLLEAAD